MYYSMKSLTRGNTGGEPPTWPIRNVHGGELLIICNKLKALFILTDNRPLRKQAANE